MKKLILLGFILISAHFGLCQGVSFSYFIPKNGYLSAPISPFSIRGLGFGDIVGLEAGATLYSMAGLSMDGLPFDYDKPLVGPHFSLLFPANVFIKLPTEPLSIKLMAGGFGWWNINTRIHTGNMDRAFRTHENWDVLNTHLKLKDKPGIGWLGGFDFEWQLTDQLSMNVGALYLQGSASGELKGSYTGGSAQSGIQTKPVEISSARILLEGMEISLGGTFSMR